jgi:hypothetical protein
VISSGGIGGRSHIGFAESIEISAGITVSIPVVGRFVHQTVAVVIFFVGEIDLGVHLPIAVVIHLQRQ